MAEQFTEASRQTAGGWPELAQKTWLGRLELDRATCRLKTLRDVHKLDRATLRLKNWRSAHALDRVSGGAAANSGQGAMREHQESMPRQRLALQAYIPPPRQENGYPQRT